MTHFGILCPSDTGHLNTMIPLGHELQRRGHKVTCFQIPDGEQKVISAGLNCQVIGQHEFPLGSMEQRYAELGKLSGLAGALYSLTIAKELTKIDLLTQPNAISSSKVEALIVDQILPAGGTIAEYLNLPFINVCSALPLHWDKEIPPIFTTWGYSPLWWSTIRNQVGNFIHDCFARPTLNLINEYRQQWKLPLYSKPDNIYSKLAKISHMPAELDFPRSTLSKSFHYTGPYAYSSSRKSISFPFEQLTGQPLIYASMGTLQNRIEKTFQTIAEACVGLDAQLVISLGGALKPESLPKLPGSPLVVHYAPQLELLKRATLTITHAGLNTTLESLSNGVPMVAIPITNDQPGVAARLAWKGAAEVVPFDKLNVPKLRKAIEQVLTQETYRSNALKLKEAINLSGGVKQAADIVEQAIATKEPVLSLNQKTGEL